MALSRIVQEGEEVKFQITINQQGFNMNEDNFRVKLTYGMLNKELVITKDQMISNDLDEWFFMFDTKGMVGRIKAECSFDVPDSDYADGFRTEVDRQCILVVISHPLPAKICVPVGDSQDHTVIYERTEQSDVAELYAYLTDRRGAYILTSDEERILVLKKEINI
jgi:hypothetical protein